MKKCKKIIFMIVEGPSDKIALGAILDRLFSDRQIFIEVVHGDITSDFSSSAANIVAKIGNLVRGYARSNHFSKGDFLQIIHLVDMDGAYIPPANVLTDMKCKKAFYAPDAIHTQNRDGILARNQKKSQILNKLSAIGKIWGLSYQIYYMSCNLDHVLYDKPNSDNREKENNSYRFSKYYKTSIPEFLDFLCKSPFSVTGDYSSSWEFIKQDLHSLERHTNLGIWLEAKDEDETSPVSR